MARVQIVARKALPLRSQGRHWPLARKFTALALVVLTLSACGQRGPLYMPDDSARKTTR